MSLPITPKTAKWPFFIGDALLLGLAWFLQTQATHPLNGPTLAACVACVTLGAVLGIVPFILDYRAEVRLAESNSLAETVDQIQGLETIAATVDGATGKWQGVHEHATKAVDSARQVSEQMSSEMKSFMEFLEKANASERQHLTLEVDKLKRAESDWLGVLVRILDHVYAIRSAAHRSGDTKVTDQLTQFQFACRDAARRVGLTPLEAEAGAAFDPKQHQLPDGAEVPEESTIVETLATGFTFRGQTIRPVIVAVDKVPSPSSTPAVQDPPNPTTSGGPPEEATTEQELSL